MYKAYICKVKNVRPAENADRLNLCEAFGNTCVVDKTVNEDTLYIYFPEGGQLSEEYCAVNDLVRRKDDAGNPCGGYLDPNKRRITTVRLRGNRSDGLVMPLSSLDYTGAKREELAEGLSFETINGHPICQKYIPKRNPHPASGAGNRTRKYKAPVSPMFAEHADTEQLAYNLDAFRPGDEIEITLKIHGTSQRTAHLPVLKGYKRTLLDRILRREGTPIYEYGYVSGTRRTVLENYEGGYYGDNAFREEHSKTFEGKLHQGETVYYEVAGFTNTGVPIMPQAKNKSLGKEFMAQYGETTTFSYGCEPEGKKVMYGKDDRSVFAIEEEKPQSDMWVYRMTYTSPEGYVIEYTPDMMRRRCEEMGVKSVPVFYKGYIFDGITNAGENALALAEEFYSGPDPIDPRHVREGVVVRIINRPKFTAYKAKNFEFKVLSGIAVAQAEEAGIEVSADIAAEM